MTEQKRVRELGARFESTYGPGPNPVVVRAPGRVNLIGEHTDYNDGFVLPIAISRETLALARPRTDRIVRLACTSGAEPAQVNLNEPLVPCKPIWANYCRGVFAGLLERGLMLGGADVLFDSTIPQGGGLSSSAALEVSSALVILSANGIWADIPLQDLALLCQKAEHKFAGAPCGIMDQSIVIMGRPGHALLLDCQNGQTEHVPFDDSRIVLLVADTQVKHAISDGGYAARRAQCESAARKLGVKSLRSANNSHLECGELDDVERMRARHVIGEIERTLKAVEALRARNYPCFGTLMYESHDSLRIDYEVSCAELDAIVDLASHQPGVYGARMTGGGFGGCAIVLAEAKRAKSIAEAIAEGFFNRFGRRCPIFATRAVGGASVLRA